MCFASCLSKPHRFEKMKLICPLSYEEILNYGATHEASPFIQVRLPRGFKHLTKASRAVSYFSDDGPNAALANSRFTRRSLASAKAAAQSWVWEW